MHLLPWKLLRRGIAIAESPPSPDSEVTMTYQVFRLLLQAALQEQPFDELAYVAANPDVGHAIQAGKCPSAHEHYLTSGYFESRDDGGAGFDESFYRRRYADVETALGNGSCVSAYRHFRGEGMLEWRSPNKAAETDIARWRSAIAAAAGILAGRQLPPPAQAVPKRREAAQTTRRA